MKTYLMSITKFSLILFLTFIFYFLSFHSDAQGISINTSGAASDNSAMLDVSGTNKGVLINRMTANQRNAITSPATGLLIYNTDCNNFNYFNGVAWVDMVGNALSVSMPDAPTAASHSSSQTQITWNWNTVSGAAGYKWNTTNTFSTAIDMGAALTKTETGLTCNTPYTRYVWAYNNCGGSASSSTLTQTTSSCFICGTQLTDTRDGKIYNTTLIGAQCWIAQNLNFGKYVTLATGQGAAGTQKYCYGDNPDNCAVYGGFYEWAQMMTDTITGIQQTSCNGTGVSQVKCSIPVQGVCPVGWHIPSHYELTRLERVLAGSDSLSFPYDTTTCYTQLGIDEGAKLKANPGFAALMGGYEDGAWSHINQQSYWWSSTQKNGTDGWYRWLYSTDAHVWRGYISMPSAFPVRCLLD
ncbi:MAG: hypothetical protein HGB12_01830 [Bacteroidetes bacterium]|nr:hypothetical protein [Bacteroidota bacterium]